MKLILIYITGPSRYRGKGAGPRSRLTDIECTPLRMRVSRLFSGRTWGERSQQRRFDPTVRLRWVGWGAEVPANDSLTLTAVRRCAVELTGTGALDTRTSSEGADIRTGNAG